MPVPVPQGQPGSHASFPPVPQVLPHPPNVNALPAGQFEWPSKLPHVPPQGPHGTKPGQTVINAKRPAPHSESDHARQPHTNPIEFIDKKLSPNECILPPHSKYREPWSRSPTKQNHLKGIIPSTGQNWVVITQRKVIVILPSGTRVTTSDTEDYMRVPPGVTGIRIIGKEDEIDIKERCEQIHLQKKRKFKTGGGAEQRDVYVTRCSDINYFTYWDIGSPFVELPLNTYPRKPAPKEPDYSTIVLLPTECIVPLHTEYRTTSSGTTYHLDKKGKRKKPTDKDWVATTPEGKVVLMPEGTNIIVSDVLRLPTGKTRIRVIDKKDELALKEWCKEIHRKETPPPGRKLEYFGNYVTRCSDKNFWNIGDDGYDEKKFVKEEVRTALLPRPKAKPQ
ncbi:hypothetical protein APHAL10511_005485 [Amanita phalloides]|nr:hypothetical protein APHAL10511_005485 [Amanita phalloides]